MKYHLGAKEEWTAIRALVNSEVSPGLLYTDMSEPTSIIERKTQQAQTSEKVSEVEQAVTAQFPCEFFSFVDL